MYVKSLEINGFKSFATNTILEFPAPKLGRHSITAIVGPNGSGKSNVSDAIRWVLGEQSMKHLRGKKSEDIIFAGSEGKGKMSLASVTMILDNSDHRAPVDYDELIIARRLYRSGESEYLLNGQQVRLFDLQILLAQGQFGQGSYSVIGQGTIDRLLLQTPAERKSFFDEAVGIKEFQIKRHHAALKLQKTQENISQAETLLQEIEPRLKSLKRQVHKLEKRQEVEIHLRELQEQYYVTLHINLSDNIGTLQTDFDSVNIVYNGAHRRLTAIQEELATLAQEKSRREVFEELQRELSHLQQEKNTLDRDHAIVVGKLQTEFSKAGKQNVSWLENKVGEFESKEKELKEEMELEKNKQTKSETEIKNLADILEELQNKKIVLHNKQIMCEQQLQELRQGRDEVQFEGLRAVNAILQHAQEFGGNVYGVVAQLARVDEKYRLALEVAAQAHLASIVVEHDNVGQRCIEFLKKQQLGFATFLPLNTIKSRIIPSDIVELTGRKGVYGLASQLVDYDAMFDHVFSYIFGSTLIVEDINVAREIGIGRVRMVTLEGDVLETSGSMKGGFRHKRRGVLSFARGAQQFSEHAIEKLEEELVYTKGEKDKLEIEIENKKGILSDLRTTSQVIGEKVGMIGGRLNDIVSELSRLKQELSVYSLSKGEYSDMMAEFAQEKEDIAKHIRAIEKNIIDVRHKVDALNDEEEKKRERIFSLQDEMQKEQTELNNVGDKRHILQVEITKLQTHQEDLEQEIFGELREGVGALMEKGWTRIDEGNLEETKIEIEKLKYQLSLIGGIDEEVMGEYEETKERYEFLSTELDDLHKASLDLEKMIAELDKLMKKKHAESFKKIKKEFARYFKLLFEGGEAELVELYDFEKDASTLSADENDDVGVTEEQPVDTGDEVVSDTKRRKKILQGVEVYACPPGKKIKNITALSGGERTMTSIALLCAILHTNPSPFVLLDEVEAALDEANTLRFTKILNELAEQSQFIIITHNRVTMHAVDVLYGVTMGNDGMSKLVSVKLDRE
ncbi:MAG TPA: hypothetical protein DCS29_03180 [Candidatus Magasanikbacteria bacterium]|nr:MAG: hypothetical protein A2479_01945 [Candidatus Magasanikbacteria bacterium RIFOXYC2_FULL_39_8]HAT03750.1 hypothetical protein [Candidatus Magasanikbacteria bacterium]